MSWGLLNLSVVAWPLIKSQIITRLPYVSSAAWGNRGSSASVCAHSFHCGISSIHLPPLFCSWGAFHLCAAWVCVGDVPPALCLGPLIICVKLVGWEWAKSVRPALFSSRSNINPQFKIPLSPAAAAETSAPELARLKSTSTRWSTKSLVWTALIRCVSPHFLPVWRVSAFTLRLAYPKITGKDQ